MLYLWVSLHFCCYSSRSRISKAYLKPKSWLDSMHNFFLEFHLYLALRTFRTNVFSYQDILSKRRGGIFFEIHILNKEYILEWRLIQYFRLCILNTPWNAAECAWFWNFWKPRIMDKTFTIMESFIVTRISSSDCSIKR